MSYAFVDRICQSCNGEGCKKCRFSGNIGSYEEVMDVDFLPEIQTIFGRNFRKWREKCRVSLRDAAQSCGLRVSSLSDIERGRREPSEAVRKRKLERLHERLLKREKAMSQAVLEDEQ